MQAPIDYELSDRVLTGLAILYLNGARPVLHADVLAAPDAGAGVLLLAGRGAGGRGRGRGGRGRGGRGVGGGGGGRGAAAANAAGAAEGEEEDEDEEEDDFLPVMLGGEGGLMEDIFRQRRRESEADPRDYLFLSMPRFGRNQELVTPSRVLAGEFNLTSTEIVRAAKACFKKDGLG